jgi:NAD+ synthase|tara:strand:- start:1207 stop:1986 length:780 start_codon:yes stop_codon:yes gene_type:complete
VNTKSIESHIVKWLSDYSRKSGLNGFVIGVSGGIDSAVTSTLCAKTGLNTIVLNMPIHQKSNQFDRSKEHINWLKKNFKNVDSHEINLTDVYESFSNSLPKAYQDQLSMANLRSRIRMSNLYVFASNKKYLVAGTGNKVEDFGVGFYTKYGDGGVDISPIADLLKSEVFKLANHLGIVSSIQDAKPTDGLWDDDRSDEDQLGATYDELEWAMNYLQVSSKENLSEREEKALKIYQHHHQTNLHKMNPIPVCKIPESLKS